MSGAAKYYRGFAKQASNLRFGFLMYVSVYTSVAKTLIASLLIKTMDLLFDAFL